RIETGHTLRELVCEQFQISPSYLEKEIKILFLNSSPVDDLDTAFIGAGATLALSGAMPGLVGAAMRRDGLSSMRSGITYREGTSEHARGPGVIFLKLFNKVMEDLAETFLRRSVYVEAEFLADYLGRISPGLWDNCRRITQNGEVVAKRALFDFLASRQGLVRFSIE
ncbi:MAG TPA: hypothetical protein VMK12_05965, partial [Anaeromyxobacteraceae bacterium]|nr:hypothetical protein [Anaeromyxobacteraceae bacterium]